MNTMARIFVAFAISLLPLGALAASLDEVTMHVMGANQHAVDVTNNIQIPDQATSRDANRNARANNSAENGENGNAAGDDDDPAHINAHATAAIQGTPAAGRAGGAK